MTGAHAHAIPREDRRFSLRALFRRDVGAEAPRQHPAYAATVTVPAPVPAVPGQASWPYPLRAPEVAHEGPVPAGVLRRLADGLRNLDGSAPTPEYQASRALLETVPFRAIREEASVPAPPLAVPAVSAAESASRIRRLTYPPPDADQGRYAAVMRQVSAYTGTRSSFDRPAAWTSARPGPAEAPVTSWMPQHPPLLAIEAGTAGAP